MKIEILNKDGWQEFIGWDNNGEGWYKNDGIFTDVEYREINKYNYLSACIIIDASFEYWSGIQRIRMIIEDVYPGKKYKDVCISEVYILGRKDF